MIVPRDADPATYPPQTCSKCGTPKPISEFGRVDATRIRGVCKPCRAATQNAWYERNREKKLERQRRLRVEDPEKYREGERRSRIKHSDKVKAKHERTRKTARYKVYQVDYAIKNRDEIKAKAAEYAAKFPERLVAAQAKYYAANREAKAERRRKWAEANPELWKAKYSRDFHRRRARSADVVNDLTADDWAEILAAQGHRCHYCKTPFGLLVTPTRDHIIPVSKGGGLTKSNVVGACQSCNSAKGTKVLAVKPSRLKPKATRVADDES